MPLSLNEKRQRNKKKITHNSQRFKKGIIGKKNGYSQRYKYTHKHLYK